MEEERGGEPLQSRELVMPGARGPCKSSPSCPRERDHPLLEVQLEVDQEEMALCGIQGQSCQCFRMALPTLPASCDLGRQRDQGPEPRALPLPPPPATPFSKLWGSVLPLLRAP